MPSRYPELIGGILVGLVVLSTTFYAASAADEQHRTELRLQTYKSLSMASQSLDGNLAARLAVIDGLAALASMQPNLTEDQFRRFAGSLDPGGVRSLQLAPGGVVTFVHPLEGNEEAVGHDLLADPARRDAVLATYEAGTTVVTGPLDLVQGGKGFIARQPVPAPPGSPGGDPWGLAVLVFDAGPLLQPLEDGPPGSTALALVSRASPSGPGSVLHGDPAVLSQNPLTATVPLPHGSWQVAAVPAGGWGEQSPMSPWIWGAGAVVTLAGAAGTAWMLHQPRRMRSRVAQATAELRTRTSQLDTLVSSLSTGVLVETGERTVLRVNRAFLETFGIQAEPHQLEGADCRQAAERTAGLFVEGETWLSTVGDRIRAGEPVHAEAFETVDGRVLERDYLPVQLEGDTRGHIWQYRDITDHREARRRLEEVNERLRGVDAMKTHLLNTASHQLKTPMTPLILQLHMLTSGTLGQLTGEQREALQVVERNVERLQALVSDLLSVSRIEADGLCLEVIPVEIAPMCQEVLQAYKPVLDEREVDATVSVPDGCTLRADAELVRQVVENLVSNAARWTPQGGGIWITAQAGDGMVEVRVRDAGPGLEPEQMDGLFRPFSQVHDPTTGAPGGTGLGLYICKGFVEAHGGEIWAESPGHGQGATFAFKLPLDGPPGSPV